jgi:ankyrin repeat protein
LHVSAGPVSAPWPSLIIYAVVAGDAAKVEHLLERDPSLVDATSKPGDPSVMCTRSATTCSYTPLHWAAYHGHTHVARILIEHGAEVNARALDRATPLHLAAWLGKTEVAGLLLRNGADPDAKDEEGTPPLQAAVRNLRPQTEQLVRGLIEAGAETDIFTASGLGMRDRVKALLQGGADLVDATDAYDATPLHWAASAGETEVVKLLLESGAKPEAGDEHGRPPMELAVRGGFSEVVGLLVDAGVDVDSRDEHGWTPLYLAALYGREGVARVLLDRGADVNGRDQRNSTPLHCAARYSPPELVKLLIARGADVNARTDEGWTPLHSAAVNERSRTEKARRMIEAARILLQNGADVNAKDNDGGTPLGRCASGDNREMASLLLKEGAIPVKGSATRASPLHSVFRRACKSATRLLTRGARAPRRPPLSEEALTIDTAAVTLFGEAVDCSDLPPGPVRRVADYFGHLELKKGALVPKPGSAYPGSSPESSAARVCHSCLGEDAWVFFAICFRNNYEPLKALAVNTVVFWQGDTPSVYCSGYSGANWLKCVPHLVDGLAGLDAEGRRRVWRSLFKEHITDEALLRKMAKAAHEERDPEVKRAAACTMMNTSPVRDGWEYYYVYQQ